MSTGRAAKGLAALAPCAVRHIDLGRGDRSIVPEADERSVYVVFWHGGVPIGDRLLVAAELPVPHSAVAALAADAGAVSRVASDPLERQSEGRTQTSTLSLAICTRNRPESLKRCLRALLESDPSPTEILVIDNAPQDGGTRAIVADFPEVRYVPEPQAGLSNARNQAVELSTSDLIAFIDDDVEVSPDWIARISTPFVDPAVGCVTGAVLPRDLSGEGACLFEFATDGLNRGFASRRFDPDFLGAYRWKAPPLWTIGAGANMAVRRRALESTGLFDPRLGAGAAGCSEDSELWFRMLRAGFACVYEPHAVVHHWHRGSVEELFVQMRAYARGHVVAQFIQFGQDKRPAHLLRPFSFLPVYLMRQFVRATVAGDRAVARLIAEQIFGCALGLIDSVKRLGQPGPPRLPGKAREP